MRCRDCKWWGHRATYQHPGMPEPVEHAPTIFCDSLIRDCLRINRSGLIEVESEPFSCGYIGTHPDFGCVLFEAKDE